MAVTPELRRTMALYNTNTDVADILDRLPKGYDDYRTNRYKTNRPAVIKGYDDDSVSRIPNIMIGSLPNSETGGFFDRWRQYRKMLREEYPLVKGSRLKDVWKMPVNYYASKIFGHISDNVLPDGSRDTIIKTLLGGASDGLRFSTRQAFEALGYGIFPRIRVMSAFSDGATDIETVYTYMTPEGFELPAYMKKRGGASPAVSADAQDDLIRNAQFIERWGISPYNKVEQTGNNFMNRYFLEFGIKKQTRGDYSTYFEQQPRKFHRGLMKNDSYFTAQYGGRDNAEEIQLSSVITNAGLSGEIKAYNEPLRTNGFWYKIGGLIGDESPSSWRMWWCQQLLDWTYDILDLGFGPVETSLRKLNIPVEGLRPIMETEYKIAAGVTRGLQPGRGAHFTYELPNRTPDQIREAAQEAAGFGYN